VGPRECEGDCKGGDMKGTELVGDPGRVEGGFDDWGPDGAGQSGGK